MNNNNESKCEKLIEEGVYNSMSDCLDELHGVKSGGKRRKSHHKRRTHRKRTHRKSSHKKRTHRKRAHKRRHTRRR
jgi:hypothetical protein